MSRRKERQARENAERRERMKKQNEQRQKAEDQLAAVARKGFITRIRRMNESFMTDRQIEAYEHGLPWTDWTKLPH